jgi:hypothetical protein
MQVLTAAPYLCNPELDCSKLISMFNKLYLQFSYNLAGISSLVPEKFDDHSLIIVNLKHTFNGLSSPDQEDHFLKSHTVESDLTYLAFRRVHTLDIC